MQRFLRHVRWTLAGLAGLCVVLMLSYLTWMWGYFSWHREDSATRKAIYAESQALMRAPEKDLVRIRVPTPPGGSPMEAYAPKHMPRTIASLKSFSVDIQRDGVFITTRRYFDDESGYFVPRDKSFDPRRKGIGAWESLGAGVWWYHLS